MYNVEITYVNGVTVRFQAQGFDLDFRAGGIGEDQTALGKFTYKDVDGNDTFIYLTPNQVAGIVVYPYGGR